MVTPLDAQSGTPTSQAGVGEEIKTGEVIAQLFGHEAQLAALSNLLEHLPEALLSEGLTPASRDKLRATLSKAERGGNPEWSLQEFNGSLALVAWIPNDTTYLKVIVPALAGVNCTAEQHKALAESFGGRLATRAERNSLYTYLEDRRADGTISELQMDTLELEGAMFIRDAEGIETRGRLLAEPILAGAESPNVVPIIVVDNAQPDSSVTVQQSASMSTIDSATPEARFDRQEWKSYSLEDGSTLIVGYYMAFGRTYTGILHSSLLGLRHNEARTKHMELGIGGVLMKAYPTFFDPIDGNKREASSEQNFARDLLDVAYNTGKDSWVICGPLDTVYDEELGRFRPYKAAHGS